MLRALSFSTSCWQTKTSVLREWFSTRTSAVSQDGQRAREPAAEISCKGRKRSCQQETVRVKLGARGQREGQELTLRARQSVYSATIERRTVMSSGFPPATEGK